MAEMMVLGKSNLLSSSSFHKHNQLSASPKSCYGRRVVQMRPLAPRSSSLSMKSSFCGRRLLVEKSGGSPKRSNFSSITAQMNLRIGKQQKWWEKGVQPNMREVESAQELVETLLNAGDKLVIVDFFSPGCGGCKALHPKICQLAEQNPEVQFLQVNYEEHKSMCYSLNVHVLPFFRFYRGASGRLCSFSCTNATIKKFRDALAKHTPSRCSLGPAKGLEEKELLALSANKDLSFTHKPKPVEAEPAVEEVVVANSSADLPLPRPTEVVMPTEDSEGKSLVTAGR